MPCLLIFFSRRHRRSVAALTRMYAAASVSLIYFSSALLRRYPGNSYVLVFIPISLSFAHLLSLSKLHLAEILCLYDPSGIIMSFSRSLLASSSRKPHAMVFVITIYLPPFPGRERACNRVFSSPASYGGLGPKRCFEV